MLKRGCPGSAASTDGPIWLKKGNLRLFVVHTNDHDAAIRAAVRRNTIFIVALRHTLLSAACVRPPFGSLASVFTHSSWRSMAI